MNNPIKEIEIAIQKERVEDLFTSFSDAYESFGGNFGTAIKIKNMGFELGDIVIKEASNEEDLENAQELIESLVEGIMDAESLYDLKDTLLNFLSDASGAFSYDKKERERISEMATSAIKIVKETLDPWIKMQEEEEE